MGFILLSLGILVKFAIDIIRENIKQNIEKN